MKKSIIYNKIDILFFERPLADLRKFAFKIAKGLKKTNDSLKLGAICIEMPLKEECPEIDYFYYRREIKDIDSFLIGSSIKLIVFTNWRIPDMEIILHAKRLHIKTLILQEGIIFDGANINDITVTNMFAVLNYLPKAISYFNIIRRMCIYDHRSFIRTVMRIFKKKKHITQIVANSFSIKLICDYVLTMGSYWHDYYINTVGYNEEKIRLIGDHDLDDLQLDTYHEKAICYIATVLVEDGSVKRSDFERFIKILAGSIDKKTKLYIKLHPRSDESLYKDLLDHNVEIIRNVPLPAVNLYIGHSSTLLGRALYESDQLIIWRFSKKIECFYEQFASAVCMDENQLKKALANTDISKHTNEKYEQISAVYWKNPRGALLSATELIYKYLKNERI